VNTRQRLYKLAGYFPWSGIRLYKNDRLTHRYLELFGVTPKQAPQIEGRSLKTKAERRTSKRPQTALMPSNAAASSSQNCEN
jgi:hypothetical protein